MKICTAGTPCSMKLTWSDDSIDSGTLRLSTPVTNDAPRKMCCHSVAVPVPSAVIFCVPRRPTVSRLITPSIFASGRTGCADVVLRPQAAGFLSRERDEHHRARRPLAGREHARQFEHHGDAARVVVGARVHLALVARVDVGPAGAQVIDVRAEHGALVLERRRSRRAGCR